MADSDWRLGSQHQHLVGAVLTRRTYRRYGPNPTWDHDHCEFCSAKFAMADEPGTLHEGYSTPDEYRWICDACVNDFKEQFRWTLTSDGTA